MLLVESPVKASDELWVDVLKREVLQQTLSKLNGRNERQAAHKTGFNKIDLKVSLPPNELSLVDEARPAVLEVAGQEPANQLFES